MAIPARAVSALLTCALVTYLAGCSRGESRIEHEGESDRLSKPYDGDQQDVADSENLHASDIERAQAWVEGAAVRERHTSLREVADDVMRVKFPGHGPAGMEAEAGILMGFSIEVPQAGRERIIVYAAEGSEWVLADDFVLPSQPGVMGVRMEGELLTYALHDAPALTRTRRAR